MGLFGDLLKLGLVGGGGLIGGPAGAAIGASVAGAVGGAEDKNKAAGLADQATRLKLHDYTQLAPVRQRAVDLAMAPNPTKLRLGGIFADAGNPYNRAGTAVSDIWAQQQPVAPSDPHGVGRRNDTADAERGVIAQLGRLPHAGNAFDHALQQWQARYPGYDATTGYTGQGGAR